MPVVLKTQSSNVIDALRSSRRADEEIDRIKMNSWEDRRSGLLRVIESANWRFGPAELLATFDHHAVCKAPNGSLVRVEWELDPNDFSFKLGKATVFESSQPISDLGHEVMETAKTAVDMILDEDFDGVEPLVESMAEALDAEGSLKRRITTEVTARSIGRDAWWHEVIGAREDYKEMLPPPQTEGDDPLAASVDELLATLKEAARDTARMAHALAGIPDLEPGIEALAYDIAEDTHQAVKALLGLDRSNIEETTRIYEAVMSVAPHLLNGLAFLDEMAATDPITDTDNEDREGQE